MIEYNVLDVWILCELSLGKWNVWKCQTCAKVAAKKIEKAPSHKITSPSTYIGHFRSYYKLSFAPEFTSLSDSHFESIPCN